MLAAQYRCLVTQQLGAYLALLHYVSHAPQLCNSWLSFLDRMDNQQSGRICLEMV